MARKSKWIRVDGWVSVGPSGLLMTIGKSKLGEFNYAILDKMKVVASGSRLTELGAKSAASSIVFKEADRGGKDIRYCGGR